MDLDTQIITVFCRMDDAMERLSQGQRLRRSGPEPVLSDAEVLTMETVGEFRGLRQDIARRPGRGPLCSRRTSPGVARAGAGHCR